MQEHDAVAKAESRPFYPESEAILFVAEGDLSFCVTRSVHFGHLCGYVRFPVRPTVETGFDGILAYVPVHGGITYARPDAEGMVYGFDCCHFGDANNSLTRDPDWVLAEARRMATGILAASRIEAEYLAEGSDRVAIVGVYHAALHERGIDFVLTDNFGAMLRALSGKV